MKKYRWKIHFKWKDSNIWYPLSGSSPTREYARARVRHIKSIIPKKDVSLRIEKEIL